MICTSENSAAATTLVNWNGGVFNKKLVASGASNKAQLMRFHGRDLALRPRHLEKAEAQQSICLSNEGYTYPAKKNKTAHEFLQLLRHPPRTPTGGGPSMGHGCAQVHPMIFANEIEASR